MLHLIIIKDFLNKKEMSYNENLNVNSKVRKQNRTRKHKDYIRTQLEQEKIEKVIEDKPNNSFLEKEKTSYKKRFDKSLIKTEMYSEIVHINSNGSSKIENYIEQISKILENEKYVKLVASDKSINRSVTILEVIKRKFSENGTTTTSKSSLNDLLLITEPKQTGKKLILNSNFKLFSSTNPKTMKKQAVMEIFLSID